MSEIESVEAAIVEALGRGDAAAVAACYTEDAVLMPPNRPAVEGRAAVEAYFREALASFAIEIASTAQEEVVAGDWGWLRTRLVQRITPRRGGRTVEVAGKALILARRGADGAWRYHRDVFNTDQAPVVAGSLGRLLAALFGRRR